MCKTLAAAGIRVVAVARRRERLEALQQTLVGQGVPIADFLPIVCDITKVRYQPPVSRALGKSLWAVTEQPRGDSSIRSSGCEPGLCHDMCREGCIFVSSFSIIWQERWLGGISNPFTTH